jgi:Protein of unknown function (DUF3499)
MSDRERVCQRAGCQRSASVTLSFRYDARQASLMDLTDQKHPAHYDLCGMHADVLIVPKGWERLDRRSPAPDPEPQIEAFVRAIEEPPPAPTRLNRYAALTAELPRLAEACGLTVPDGGEAPAPLSRVAPEAPWAVGSRAERDDQVSRDAQFPGRGSAEAPARVSRDAQFPGRGSAEAPARVSRDAKYGGRAAPYSYDGVAPATRLYEPVTDTMTTQEQVIEGQLQMPIEPEPEGVVVALMRTRQA